jgi:hypothetical protein
MKITKLRRVRALSLGLTVAGLAAGLFVPVAAANINFQEVGVSIRAADGSQSRVAGAHPDFTFSFTLPEVEETRENTPYSGPVEAAKDIELELPRGMYANPNALGVCTQEQFINENLFFVKCPSDSQVGVATVGTLGTFGGFGKKVGVFNLEHGPDVPAVFGIKVQAALIRITPRVRPSDYGIDSVAVNTTQAEALRLAKVTLWGVPSDPSHDTERVGPFEFEIPQGRGPIPATSPRVPFFTNPGDCAARDDHFTARIDSWEHVGVFDVRELNVDQEGAPFLWEGCETQAFESELKAQPGSRQASTPTGIDVNLSVTASEGPDARAAANVKRTVLEFPPGMAIAPGAAAGLGACTEAQVGLGNNNDPTCPDNSKIGTVSIKTQLLKEPIEGDVVLASQKANPFGSNYAVYVLAKGPGFWLKVPGEIQADPQTGQLKAIFDDMPQLPFENVHLQLDGGANAPLVTPPTCGNYSIRTEIFSWARPTEPTVATQPMNITEGCSAGGFNPTLQAGVSNPIAGAKSPLSIRVHRSDGEGNLSQLEFVLPKGELASLAGVPLCSDAAAPSGNCPSGSQVGVLNAAVGSGSSPLQIPQPGKTPTALYLAGPYKGAPYSLVAKVPAQAGPFDLGTVTVRNTLNIDPFTTQVTAKSDPLPQILEGVPITYRDVNVEVNRPDFTVNPTNCTETSVGSKLTSASGQTASPSVRYQVGGCAELEFKPTLKVQLKGATKRTGRPALKAVLTYPSKGSFANIARAQVNLPKALFLEQNNLNKTCTKPVLLAGNCPATSIYGKAKAWSPLLDRPLEGPVYLVGGFGYKLPALVADLNGQIRVLLASKVDSGPNKGLRTTFEAVPDAPVSRFVLEMKGGKKYGLLINSENLCKGSPQLKAAFTGQNGAVDNFEQKIEAKCGGKKSKSKAKPKHKTKGK